MFDLTQFNILLFNYHVTLSHRHWCHSIYQFIQFTWWILCTDMTNKWWILVSFFARSRKRSLYIFIHFNSYFFCPSIAFRTMQVACAHDDSHQFDRCFWAEKLPEITSLCHYTDFNAKMFQHTLKYESTKSEYIRGIKTHQRSK